MICNESSNLKTLLHSARPDPALPNLVSLPCEHCQIATSHPQPANQCIHIKQGLLAPLSLSERRVHYSSISSVVKSIITISREIS